MAETISKTARRKNQRRQVTVLLENAYPKLFNRAIPVPLAIGIHSQIQTDMPEIPKQAVKDALAAWCSRRKYLQAMIKKGAQRINLNAEPSGDVTAEERDFANERLLSTATKK